MATYKLIQDIEAEDHIIGPLTLRQFIFALITAFFCYMSFLALSKHIAFLLILFLPPAIFFGFFAVPFGRDQPTEVWALAKIRFWLKPRRRIWDQSGIKQLVTITAPKKLERILTNGLSTTEVQSRLKTLANTLDSRGWAVKNAPLQQPQIMTNENTNSDRLIDASYLPQAVPDTNIADETDVFDEQNSPLVQHFEQMISQSNQAHKQQLIQQMNSGVSDQSASAGSSPQWFAPHINTTPAQVSAPDVPAQDETPAEQALAEQLKARHKSQTELYSNLRTLRPFDPQAPQPTLTTKPDPAILSLANNDDFDVATIAREARRANGEGPDEVVVPLR